MNQSVFIDALKNNDIAALAKIPKSDLHSHAGRAGNLSYIERYTHVKIKPPAHPFDSLGEMNSWFNKNVKSVLPESVDGYLKRIEAAFVQAATDNITVLALSFGIDEIESLGGMRSFVSNIDMLHKTFAPKTMFCPDLALGYTTAELRSLDEIFSFGWFNGIDIMNYMNTYSMHEMKCICHKAKDCGLILKAHIGEFGEAEDVYRYGNELELDQIQHGVLAAKSPRIMRWLADNSVQLNVCPTSNYMLKVCDCYESHPIRTLFDYGVKVTVNTDDLLIFNSTVSEEYLKLYHAGIPADVLDIIRKNGLERG
ncbi:MAG: adenosine deaminase [Oscillospiraceae bacterium]|nr:adenosine deaminase [Oscillospiraceae bacterium]